MLQTLSFQAEVNIQFEIPIHRWSARAGELRSETDWQNWFAEPHDILEHIKIEPIKGINPMMLRRLGSLGTAAVSIAKELLACVPVKQSLSVLTVSELGELATHDVLIESIVSKTVVSPQRFAASVHNHILGQICINLELPCAGGASTGARGGLEIGLIEALSEMKIGNWVLVLILEPAVDENYAQWYGGRSQEHIVGVLLQPDASLKIRLQRLSNVQETEKLKLCALHWLSFVAGNVNQFDGQYGWRWTHVAA